MTALNAHARHLPGLTMGYHPQIADVRPLPLVEREARLKRLLRRRANHIVAEAMSIEGHGKALFAAVEEHDLEGIVAKRKTDPYRRSVKWWKVLNPF